MTLTRDERLLGLFAVFFAPFWTFDIGFVNLTVMDLAFIGLAMLIVLHGREVPLFPTKGVGAGVILFLVGAAGSLLGTAVGFGGLLEFLQYVLVFTVIVPCCLYLFQNKRARWQAIVLVTVAIDIAAVATLLDILLYDVERTSIWYGNINQLYWILATGVLLNGILAVQDKSQLFRGTAATFTVLTLGLVVNMFSALSGPLLVLSGGWLLVLLTLSGHERFERYVPRYLLATALSGLGFLAALVTFRNYFVSQGSLGIRIWHVKMGIKYGLTRIPFGTGLDSAQTVFRTIPNRPNYPIHSGPAAYLMETGIAGFTGFTLVVVYWVRNALVPTVLGDWPPYERLGVVIFFGFLIAVWPFQPVPPRRFWWVFFAFGFAVVRDRGYGIRASKL